MPADAHTEPLFMAVGLVYGAFLAMAQTDLSCSCRAFAADGSNMKAVHLVLHVPLMIALAIMTVLSTDLELFAPLKTEFTYGYWVVVGVPAAVLLMIAQVILWGVWLGGRKRARS